MSFYTQEAGFIKINDLGKKNIPFLFIISYDKTKIFVQELDKLDKDIFYKVENSYNYNMQKKTKNFTFTKSPIDFKTYENSFSKVIEEIRSGNTYLLNLTFKTTIESSLTLKEMFFLSKSKYKLYFKDEFICFSPENFINIENSTISTYPMKGTIDASIHSAKEKILNNEKELAEHVMIVDLMRNDLGIVGRDIDVENFRYVEKIHAGEKDLLQVSSKITAKLKSNWHENIGHILNKLTPAGSITGTPKKSTVEIISNIEDYERGFYTGVFGIYNGKTLNSSVMIRFIEQEENALVYKSGGGITIDSNVKDEYKELIDKIYI
ncbi:Para-aminobenzoate synthase, aminase component [hydrothermal vent metagenome]|uniref:Para-aminobenzoate synthase, aminase component n=1 Tax=hydrothermal vent metagenome TaxID=652676 RepID=A0A1W1EEL2_9ZZZZ